MSKQMPRPEPASIQANRGVTFLELLTALVVMGILAAVAVPAFRDFIVNNQMNTQTNQLLADLALARTQAVTLSRSVRISAPSGAWEDGWQVASDFNQNGAIDGAGDQADAAFREQAASPDAFQLTMTDAGGTALTSLWFSRLGTGVEDLPAGVSIQYPVNFSLERPDRDNSRARTLCIGASGVASLRKGLVGC